MAPRLTLTILMVTLNLALFASQTVACPPIIGDCFVLPPNDEFNRPIDTDPVDYSSSCVLDHIASSMISSGDSSRGYTSAMLRLDAGVDPTDTYGMAYNIVQNPATTQLFYNSTVDNYQDESDWFLANGSLVNGRVSSSLYSPAYMKFPPGMAIEGWGGSPATDPTSGDRHGIVMDSKNCKLYEAWSVERNPGSYTAVNSAAFDLNRVLPQRPQGWTSADAAGLPIFPGVLRYEEIETGEVSHALRFTISRVQKAYTSPATKGGTSQSNLEAYYGARFRLKAGFDISGYQADVQVLLRALKKYGLILADQGSTAYITCNNNPGFGNGMLTQLNQGNAGPTSKRIAFNSANFELVQSPFPITYSYSNAPLTCGSSSANPGPFTPNFNPTCSMTPSSTPPSSIPPTTTPPSGSPPTGSPPTGSPPTGSPPTGSPPTGSPSTSPTGTTPSNDASSSSLSVLLLSVAILSLFFI